MYENAVNNIVKFVSEHQTEDYIVSFSGGKDSLVCYNAWNEALNRLDFEPNWEVPYENTSNDTADTYRYIKKTVSGDKLHIINPEIGYYKWIEDVKHYFLPSKRVRNCCSTYKEGQLTKHYDNNKPLISVIGVRKHESLKRSEYEMIMDYDWNVNHFGRSNFSKLWINFAPIIDFTDEDVWLLILKNNWDFNRMYRLGFHRVGCLICPFQQDYIDLLIQKHYPKAWNRWLNVLKINYDTVGQAKTLKWTYDEWASGAWKEAISKEYFIINSKCTPEKIKELAELKGVSETMAEKYWGKTCSCGAKCNPTEIAMFYKTQGRLENEEDTRIVLCRKCLSEQLGIDKKQYFEMANSFRNDGCNLF